MSNTLVIVGTRVCVIAADLALVIITWRLNRQSGMIPNIYQTSRRSIMAVIYHNGKSIHITGCRVRVLTPVFSRTSVLHVRLAPSKATERKWQICANRGLFAACYSL